MTTSTYYPAITTAPQVMGNDLDVKQSIDRPRILIIDDDMDFVEMMKGILRSAGYDVSSAYDHLTALSKVVEIKPCLILLDIMMPEVDGWGIYSKIAKLEKIPVIFISAAPFMENILHSFEIGAEDFISKPFNNQELIARINRVIRHAPKEPQKKNISFPAINLSIDPESKEVVLNKELVHLLPREYSLLLILAEKAPHNVPYEKITSQMWGEDSAQNRAHLKTIVFLLKKKLNDIDVKNPIIANNRGVGYQILLKKE